MPEIGQSNHAGEEEVFIDIPVDTEQLVDYAPMAPVPTDSDDDDAARAEVPEPVRGRVLRFASEDDGEPEEAAEEDPEEDPEETEPVGYFDGMGSTADDIIEGLTERSQELEDRVAHLEEQNAVHQEREDQYRDLAYQRDGENRELRQQLEQLQQRSAADSQRLAVMEEHRAQTEGRANRFRAERDATRTELQVLGHELLQTRADRDVFYDAWEIAAIRMTDLEAEVRTSTARIDVARMTLDSAFSRLRSRIRRYPREEDMSRQVVTRRVVNRIARQEHEGAITRRGF